MKRVLVTGATGFVGSHTVAALHTRGVGVRVLARTPAKVGPTLDRLGVPRDDVEIAAGDMTDPDAVADALDGCDGVVHAAAEIAVAAGRGPAGEANVEGVRQVVGQAVAARLDPIVYTSSVAVHLPASESVLVPASPLAEPLSTYGRAKHDAELLVRGWQHDGAPVTTVVLGSIYGPVSPHLDGSFTALISALGSFMAVSDGGMGIVDVRDAAEVIVRALVPGRGPRRLMAGGPFLTWAEWADTLSEAIGRPVPVQRFTAAEMIQLGHDLDTLRDQGPVDIPLSEEAAVIMTSGVPTDDSQTEVELDIHFRATVDTFRDAVAWLIAEGHLARSVVQGG